MTSLSDLGFKSTALLCAEILPEDFLKKNEIQPQSSIIIAFFPILDETGRGFIAPFALKNYYKEIIKRMRMALKKSGSPFSELNKKQVRFFSNSGFPEKDLAIWGGLGFRGRNTLLINTSYGSTGLLGGMVLPYKLRNAPNPGNSPIAVNCGTCRLCEEACPGGALKDYKLDRNKCLQHWTTTAGPVPDRLKEVWGRRIYGCMICQDCCPWNRKLREGNNIDLGAIAPEPALNFYLTEKSEVIKNKFKGTALGLSWIRGEQLIRNAILSSSFTPDHNLMEIIKGFETSEDEGIRDAVQWVRKKSGQAGN